jgi:hypothetical protein
VAPSPLDREARTRYARQISIAEIGERGQQLLLSGERAPFSRPAGEAVVHEGRFAPSRPDSARVAAMYLERAGAAVKAEPTSGREIESASDQIIAKRAGHPALCEAAAFLIGALDAVEAIKVVLDAGTPLMLPDDFRLIGEHSS